MAKQLNIFSAACTPDPVAGSIHETEKHLHDVEKAVKSRDNAKPLNDMISAHEKNWGINSITGKPRTSTPGGFKVSAPMESGYARGHNIRDPNYVEDKKHIDPEGHHETLLDMGTIEKCYDEIFSEPLEEYNSRQSRKDRRIDNYLTHILHDKRRGSMKRNSSVDNSRKANYGFIFEIGNRDHQVDRELANEILKKFVTERMPERFPNLKAICIALHDDEYTIHPVTQKRIDSAPHVHFDFIPVAHRLSEDEMEDFERWKQELMEKEKAECKSKGIKFSKEEFKSRDWEYERAKRYGKAEMNSLSLQSSLSGACAEMGFRTQGINTAQIQMEKAVREDFLDFVESYGIPMDRTVEENPQKKVRIDVYKAREDAKAVIKEVKEILKQVKKDDARNQKKEKELEKREKNVEGLEEKKKLLDKKEDEVLEHEKAVQKREDKIAPYEERIDTLVQDEAAVKVQKENADKRDAEQDKRDEELDERESSLVSRKESLDKSEDSLNTQETDLDSREAEITNREAEVQKAEERNREDAKRNQENAERNEANLKEINYRIESFAPLEEKYKKYSMTVNSAEQIKVDVDSIGKQLMAELAEPGASWRSKVEYAVENFKDRCQKIVIKCQDAIRGFRYFLQGKTPQDFRNLADDMELNGAKNFEEYERKWHGESLNWQVEEKRKKLALKPVRRSYEVERD
ncbi:MAG: hypothetical protein KBT11_10550 [Treponema sp.]|nr:hypothetical protein [Candidatus Treponema equifaecale]